MDYSFLNGEWYITHSNFPMWLKGTKSDPTLNYASTPRPGVLEDIVRYAEKGKQKVISGTDKAQNSTLVFEWRGKGLLYLLKSRWKVEYISERDWMILSFEKTLLTPAGHDMASRRKQVRPEQLEQMETKFKELFPQMEIFRLK